jgi:hypothetical protein
MRLLSARLDRPSLTYWIALGLTGLIVAYMGMWTIGVLAVLLTDSTSQMFGVSLRDVIRYTQAIDLVLFFAATSAFALTFALLCTRRAISAVSLGAAIMLHFALWIRLTTNPVYDAPIALLVIAIEVVDLLLILRLSQRQARR